MIANQLETIHAAWVDELDEAFFRVVQGLFTAALVYSAGVLLATYDDDEVDATVPRTGQRSTRATAETATQRVHS